MKLPAFDYRCPSSLAEAIKLLSDNAEIARPLAGGQTLLPMMAFRVADPALLIDLKNVPQLGTITIEGDTVTLGAMAKWCEIEASAALRSACPILADAIAHVAHYQIRNRGTVGGSLAHGDPASEMPGLAVLCDAQIRIAGAHGEREIAAADFFLGPLTTALDPGELITGVRMARWPAERKWAFDEFGIRRGDFAMAGIGLYYDSDGNGRATNAHVAVIGATDIPRRLRTAEAVINGAIIDDATIARAAKAAAAEVDPTDDIHASIAYRRALVETLVERTLTHASR